MRPGLLERPARPLGGWCQGTTEETELLPVAGSGPNEQAPYQAGASSASLRASSHKSQGGHCGFHQGANYRPRPHAD